MRLDFRVNRNLGERGCRFRNVDSENGKAEACIPSIGKSSDRCLKVFVVYGSAIKTSALPLLGTRYLPLSEGALSTFCGCLLTNWIVN